MTKALDLLQQHRTRLWELAQAYGVENTRLPDRWKQRMQAVNWKALAAFRNVLVHDCLGDSDLVLVWGHIEKQLPARKKELLAILPEMEKKS